MAYCSGSAVFADGHRQAANHYGVLRAAPWQNHSASDLRDNAVLESVSHPILYYQFIWMAYGSFEALVGGFSQILIMNSFTQVYLLTLSATKWTPSEPLGITLHGAASAVR